eukprot:3437972-Alexandrium_andersonii.AAC.1
MREAEEVAQFCRDLDRHGKLVLALPAEVPKAGCMPLMAVPKSQTQGSLVGDRRAQNAWEAH